MTDLSALGITQEKLQEMVVDRLVSEMREEFTDSGLLIDKLQTAIQNQVDERLHAFIETRVPEIVDRTLSDLQVLKPRTRYGERDQPPISFTEYCCTVAKEWLTEAVDYNGRKSDYGRGEKARIVWLVHQHLESEIKSAVERVLKDAHAILGNSIQAVVTDSLKRIVAAVQVQVKQS